MLRNLTRGEAGVSLIEVAVAVLILSIALIGTFRVLDQGTRQAAGERDRLLGLMVAQNLAAEWRLGERGLPETVDLGGRQWTVRAEVSETAAGFDQVAIAVSPVAKGPAVRLLTYLDAGGTP